MSIHKAYKNIKKSFEAENTQTARELIDDMLQTKQPMNKEFTMQDFFDGLREIVREAHYWWYGDNNFQTGQELLRKYYPNGYYSVTDEMIVNMYLKETKKEDQNKQ